MRYIIFATSLFFALVSLPLLAHSTHDHSHFEGNTIQLVIYGCLAIAVLIGAIVLNRYMKKPHLSDQQD